MNEYELSKRAGRLAVEKINDQIILRLYYSADKLAHVDTYIKLFPEEMDKLCEWWKKAK